MNLFQSHDESDYLMLWKSIFNGINVLSFNFITCESGQRLTNSFDEVDDDLGQLDWYLFPIEIQRLLPMTIMNVQEPPVIKCFGNIQCSREQFKKVWVCQSIKIHNQR